jgi:hypothetical protein
VDDLSRLKFLPLESHQSFLSELKSYRIISLKAGVTQLFLSELESVSHIGYFSQSLCPISYSSRAGGPVVDSIRDGDSLINFLRAGDPLVNFFQSWRPIS